MRKVISLLLVIVCVVALSACAKKNDKPMGGDEATSTPVVQQGDKEPTDNTDATSGTNGDSQATVGQDDPASTAPESSDGIGIDLEEDILTGDDDTTSTSAPTPTPTTSSGNETTTDGTQATSVPTDATQPTAAPTATATAGSEPTASVIKLPMDIF